MKNKKKNLLIFILSTFAFGLLYSCGSSKSNKSNDESTNLENVVEEVSDPNVFSISGEDIYIRKGPGNNYSKIVNQKATEVTHNTEYLTVDNSCKVRVEDEKNGWSKIVVVDPDWLTESHQGWIESKFIVKTESENPQTLVPRRIQIFNNITKVITLLSNVGIGELSQWKNDGIGWASISNYYQFGSSSVDYGPENNLSFYMESENESYIETIKLVLNINNSSENTQALNFLDKISNKTFNSLSLKNPAGLSTAIKSGKNFSYNNTDYSVTLTLQESKINSWVLEIKSK